MRYKTFRTLVVVGGAGVAVLGFYAFCRGGDSAPGPAPEPRPAAPAAASPAAGPQEPATGAAVTTDTGTADADALRPMDREILARVDENISGDKKKDAISGRSFKVNLYKDAGQAFVNRLKIDLDRDEKWDEKWTFLVEDGKRVVKRQVAPADDESYSVEYRLEGERWRRK